MVKPPTVHRRDALIELDAAPGPRFEAVCAPARLFPLARAIEAVADRPDPSSLHFFKKRG